VVRASTNGCRVGPCRPGAGCERAARQRLTGSSPTTLSDRRSGDLGLSGPRPGPPQSKISPPDTRAPFGRSETAGRGFARQWTPASGRVGGVRPAPRLHKAVQRDHSGQNSVPPMEILEIYTPQPVSRFPRSRNQARSPGITARARPKTASRRCNDPEPEAGIRYITAHSCDDHGRTHPLTTCHAEPRGLIRRAESGLERSKRARSSGHVDMGERGFRGSSSPSSVGLLRSSAPRRLWTRVKCGL
jgi:hypothetical protein